jgi:hypothetical protein
MASLLPLYLDLTSKRLVLNESNPRVYALPDFFTEDTLTIEFRALRRISETVPPFFTRVTLSSLTIGIGDASGPTLLASSSAFTLSDSNTLLTGTLALNTAGINNLANAAQQIFEMRLFDGLYYYRAQTTCRILKSVFTVGALQPVAGDTALGTLAASRTYVPYEMPAGAGIIMQNSNGVRCLIHLTEDSIPALVADPIS